MDRYRGWITLNLLPDVGRARFNRLLDRFGTPDAVLAASRATLAEVEGVGVLSAETISGWRGLVDPDAELRRVDEAGAALVCLADPEYPALLRRMAFPPPLLYYRGSLSPADEAGVAVIGCRKISRYGRDTTREIAVGLARAGVTVVSGLALGVDAQAHAAALEAGGRTLAILGNGLSHVYPAQHRSLAEQVAESGALISEMPMDATPDAGSFPQRNAIIAGLALGVVVVEAAQRSGTSITVGCALEENRTVMAVPGDVNRVNSVGTNQLIRDGARLVTCARDILLELGAELRHLVADLPDLADPPENAAPVPPDLGELGRRIHDLLERDTLHLDDLAVLLEEAGGGTQPPQGELLGALLDLEMRGLVRQEPGMRFRRS